ncbi:hypothetical protein EUX98_g517 [Antrodiella citrinella]|uniref:assimilatory sulfite reductase (NADPH) n=1 Tax=Antrodiella citrinella TaxID=2447956 RepID=A0A4S4N5V3_9APHY|nr:hypothetical protein EUX98_g517 [Antrodiella citrinella]
MEKLMHKLGASQKGAAETPPKKKKKKAKGKMAEPDSSEVVAMRPTAKSPSRPLKKSGIDAHVPLPAKSGSSASPKSAKKRKNIRQSDNADETTPPVLPSTKPPTGPGLTDLQAKMQNSLHGARFRWINETLYKSDSEHAHQMMRENPSVFSEYHTGFRHQVQSWPVNPVSHYVATLSRKPSKTVIVDLGCGDAALARALQPKGFTVLSYDLVSDDAYVVEADICSRIPLPGGEDEEGTSSAVADVAVCALSLMGTNWPKCIREAWRILNDGGELKVAEVASRFTDVDAFTSLICSIGFELLSSVSRAYFHGSPPSYFEEQDDSSTHFTLFEFVKIARKPKNEKDWTRIMSGGDVLKPCEYKRRRKSDLIDALDVLDTTMTVVDMRSSGISTPVSATSTLSVPPSPDLSGNPHRGKALFTKTPLASASTVIERIASRASTTSTVFIYDLAEQAGFGALTQSWARSDAATAPVVTLQTRAGAGLSLVGRLSQSSSKSTASNAVLTAYNTPTGLASMMYSLSYLPAPNSNSRLIIQVPTVTPVGETFALSPTLAPFTPALAILPDHFTVLLSATPQEAVDLAALSYRLTHTHVVHIFDHHGATRELGQDLSVSVPVAETRSSVKDSLALAGYKPLDYVGDADAHTVIVVLNGPLAQAIKSVASKTTGLGVISVRLLRPWNEETLREIIPSSAKTVFVVDDVPTDYTQGALYLDVFSSLVDSSSVVKSLRVTPARLQTYLTNPMALTSFIVGLLPTIPVPAPVPASGVKRLLFFSSPKSGHSEVPEAVNNTFSSPTLSVRHLTDHDAFSKPGGITANRIIVAKKGEELIAPLHFALPISQSTGEADFISVLDPSVLKTHSVAAHLKTGSPLLIVTDWSPEELVANIHPETASLIRERHHHLCTINVKEVTEGLAGSSGPLSIAVQNAVAQLAFLRLYLGQVATEDAVTRLAAKTLAGSVPGIDLSKLAARTWAGLVEVELPETEAADAKAAPLKLFEFNAIAVDTDGETVVNGAKLGSWHDAAKHIIFPSAFTPPIVPDTAQYTRNPALRPEVSDHTFLVTCTVNKRLTPLDYDRNVFHLEFDTSNTGLKYEIGEALGVHGWNDADEVLEFCEWYGVDPNKIITIPVLGGDGTQMHSRTVFQALQQQVDLFGKPGKTFYADLSEHATRQQDQYALRFIASPEGSSTFKKLAEKDTVHFAEILRRYPSAKPSIEKLCEMIGDTKPRHYSIASAQAVVGDRVDLLVVTVDWVTPSGSPRYGQCTRYLAGLKVGQKVTVSVRPSVMKLPPDNTQPLIMTGLGTGAAPFRAFLQYRALLASQNIPVGPTYYYFGSRHRSQEYLYGEEIEAFILDNTITRAGLAFSRDQKHKIYIQDLMKEDGEDLVRMLLRENGVFYLCGPTWPVPDVFEALVSALGQYEGVEAEKAGDFLEDLKGEERYVLEVY